jgi:hypothetical protein
LRTLIARLQGIDPSDLALRDALPFSVQEIFLVQRQSGLLISHSQPGTAEIREADLVTGMLTAIRAFVRDSFGLSENEDVSEIEYGDQRIIIQNGQALYAAVVITGTEPEGFRAALNDFVSALHVRHGKQLRDFRGDPDTLPYVQPAIAHFVARVTERDAPSVSPLTFKQVLAIVAVGLGIFLCLGILLFYLRFTLALLPTAFPGSATLTSTSTGTVVPSITPSLTLTSTLTPTDVPTATVSPSPAPTKTPLPTSTATPEIPDIEVISDVWVYTLPEIDSTPVTVLPQGTVITIVGSQGDWLEIEWNSLEPLMGERQRGWVPARWINGQDSDDS